MPGIEIVEGEIPARLISDEFNEGLIHQVVVSYEANQRRGLAHTKAKPEISGPNKKPWRQKGTGRSRHGSERTPLWVGGGRAHGPEGDRDFRKSLNKKMKRRALASALGVRHREERLRLIDPPALTDPDTSTMHQFFEEEGLIDEDILLLLDPEERILRLSTRNLSYCSPADAASLNTYQVVGHSMILFSQEGLDAFTGRISNGN